MNGERALTSSVDIKTVKNLQSNLIKKSAKKKVGDIAPRFKTCSPDRLFLHDAGTSLTTGINAGKEDLCRTTAITLFLSVANVCLIKVQILKFSFCHSIMLILWSGLVTWLRLGKHHGLA